MKASLFVLWVISSFGYAEVPSEITPPMQFKVTENWLSQTKTFEIASDAGKMGTVYRPFLSLLPTYVFYGLTGEVRAKAEMRWFYFGPIFDITDGTGQPLGRVEQNLMSFFPTFDLIKPNGQVWAVGQFNFFETTYTLRCPFDQHVLATLSRPFFRIKEEWTFKVQDPNAFYDEGTNSNLFTVLAAFQSDVDSWKTAHSIIKSRKKCSDGVFKKKITSLVEARDNLQALALPKKDIEQAIKRQDDKFDVFQVCDSPEEQKAALQQITQEFLKNLDLTQKQNEALLLIAQKRIQEVTAKLKALEATMALQEKVK